MAGPRIFFLYLEVPYHPSLVLMLIHLHDMTRGIQLYPPHDLLNILWNAVNIVTESHCRD